MENLEKYYLKFWEIFRKILKSLSENFDNQFKKIQRISRNTSEIFENYLRKFRKIFPKTISSNILIDVENFLGKFCEVFRKISKIIP